MHSGKGFVSPSSMPHMRACGKSTEQKSVSIFFSGQAALGGLPYIFMMGAGERVKEVEREREGMGMQELCSLERASTSMIKRGREMEREGEKWREKERGREGQSIHVIHH